jgi:hypothetical protein
MFINIYITLRFLLCTLSLLKRIYCKYVFIVRCFLLLSFNPQCKSATHPNPKGLNQPKSLDLSLNLNTTHQPFCLFIISLQCLFFFFQQICASNFFLHKRESGAANHSKQNRNSIQMINNPYISKVQRDDDVKLLECT